MVPRSHWYRPDYSSVSGLEGDGRQASLRFALPRLKLQSNNNNNKRRVGLRVNAHLLRGGKLGDVRACLGFTGSGKENV